MNGVAVRISDPADRRLADYLRLTDVALRRLREPAEGLFIAEGEKVIRRAVAAGYPVRSFLLEDKWLPGLEDVVQRVDAPVYLAGREVLDAVTGYAVHRGALASMARLPLPGMADLVAAARRIAVLEDVNDHTNVGAIFRAAAGLGLDAVLLSPRSADPLYRRAVKVSMGAVFAVPYARVEPWPAGLDALGQAGFTLAALAPTPDAVALDAFTQALPARLALLLGTEGHGLSARSLERADVVVRIPMAAGTDSLNVAAAAAVAFYAVTRDADVPGSQSRR